MIENKVQYMHSKKKLSELQEDLRAIQKKYSSDKNRLKLFSQGYKEHITQLKSEIKYYKSRRNNIS